MNRRSFLAALGVAPVVAASGVVAAKAEDISGYVRTLENYAAGESTSITTLDANIGTVTAGSMHSADGSWNVDFGSGVITIVDV